jgi:hypothetical protein
VATAGHTVSTVGHCVATVGWQVTRAKLSAWNNRQKAMSTEFRSTS